MWKTTGRQANVIRRFLTIIACTALLLCSTVCCLANPPELITAYQEGYPKYYRAKNPVNAEVQGLCIDILHAIEKTTGLYIRAPYGFIPFRRLQSQLADGRIDLFIGMAKNEARLKKYIFIDTPLYEVNHIIAARQSDNVNIQDYDDIRNLAPDNIILTNFSTATERLLKRQEGLNIDSEGTTIAANLKKLMYGRGRFICFHDLALLGAIERYGYSKKIRVLPLILKTYYHYIAFAPDTP